MLVTIPTPPQVRYLNDALNYWVHGIKNFVKARLHILQDAGLLALSLPN
jgi:hypothetical protein